MIKYFTVFIDTMLLLRYEILFEVLFAELLHLEQPQLGPT